MSMLVHFFELRRNGGGKDWDDLCYNLGSRVLSCSSPRVKSSLALEDEDEEEEGEEEERSPGMRLHLSGDFGSVLISVVPRHGRTRLNLS